MDEISTNLRSLKMPGMAHFWQTLQETRRHDELSLKDGLQMMIQAELDNRTMSRFELGQTTWLKSTAYLTECGTPFQQDDIPSECHT